MTPRYFPVGMSLLKTVYSTISGTEHDGGLKIHTIHKDSKNAPRCKVPTAKQASAPASGASLRWPYIKGNELRIGKEHNQTAPTIYLHSKPPPPPPNPPTMSEDWLKSIYVAGMTTTN